MKKHTLTVFILTLFFNIIVSFFIGVRYKSTLENLLTSPIYYQVVIFISLTLPLIISAIYRWVSRSIVMWRFYRFKKKSIDVSKLDEETKNMYQAMVNQDIPTSAQVKDMFNALNDQFK
ncbi:TPA: hypothetical protein ACTW9M_000791 [Klebsiella michiganensis]|uniref:hypothetical protein n=1 Tax=Klebsiella variicola TaxID=244366 RepID=UPI001BCA9CE6|nr:hypothetical protein [Klebsiella variicola]HBR3253316.1 hypothetical protein [Klebsiella pneumoniae]